MKNYYEELEVTKNATDEVINRAYKVLAKKYHPDTTTVDKQLAEERFKKISEAYETLSNKQKREAYDKTLTPDVDINNSRFFVEYIDVGQGDSILIGCNEEYMLIDAGESYAYQTQIIVTILIHIKTLIIIKITIILIHNIRKIHIHFLMN